ncbi:MAG: MBL fold metallo-hydrolase [Rhodospirillales bacterium]|nr:MBL fold metallo-hydrolase [Rhodospirillales bacterium]MCW8861973.1 MBL fold metallo-hydrolase [Rhodospirillales bacterium]MCW8951422.1 MBL fold metallo-hydrolase [Rhodospirillales bacterium]MCW8970188.1 MBL fold metallo-hydrolase [Rhodospirillales bacterium]MCW9001746.1 MBL fold metallo-hydrolase [Rhodospirillales bacterium]
MVMRVKFWGVRGSIACPSPSHVTYGGNTSCIEVDAGGSRLILDAGTGIRNLGRELTNAGVREATLLLTHTHWDHINGFPFFSPAFEPGNKFHIMAGHLADLGGIESVLANQMANPMFPIPLGAMKADLTFEDFKVGETLTLSGGFTVKTCPLNHPNGSTGYRIEHSGNSVCLITDTEHVPGKPDQNILSLIEGADLVIYDSTYTEQEFVDKVGWGHSTWEEGVRLCKAAGVKSMAIFHHDPDHDDAFMERLEEKASSVWPQAFVARDNMIRLVG